MTYEKSVKKWAAARYGIPVEHIAEVFLGDCNPTETSPGCETCDYGWEADAEITITVWGNERDKHGISRSSSNRLHIEEYDLSSDGFRKLLMEIVNIDEPDDNLTE